MKLLLNGKEKELSDKLTVGEFLVEEKVKFPDMVVIELNGQILKKENYQNTSLNEGDKMELLYFMGGGYSFV
tara:strand:+ start:2455 stop:2670 length:216 start_codon:yes stop_codon:yes gene_type:complete